MVDPSELRRLYTLYKAEFTNITQEDVKLVIPPSSEFDANGVEIIHYYAETNGIGDVTMVDNKAKLRAVIPDKHKKPTMNDIPGARSGGEVKNGWFSFVSPTNAQQEHEWHYTKEYLHSKIWITNRENFFNFAMLALGTNTPPSAFFSVQNGLFMQLR